MKHFYTKDGICVRGLREARKVSACPSPTTVLSMLSSEGLKIYFRRQMFDAAMTTPRNEKLTDDEFYAECCKWADEHGQIARDKGGEFHDLIQSYNLARKHQKPIPEALSQWEGQYRNYIKWYEENVAESILVEEVVFGGGYAGRVDHICRLKNDRIFCVDVKTQALKGKKKFAHYTSWALQLGAYMKAYWKHRAIPEFEPMAMQSSGLISLCFSSDEPNGFEAYEWPKSPNYYYDLFAGLLAIWREDNNYFQLEPTIDIVP